LRANEQKTYSDATCNRQIEMQLAEQGNEWENPQDKDVDIPLIGHP
jgi:hypothetical protein